MRYYLVVNTILFPGFAMNASMYSRLDLPSGSTCIDITTKRNWDDSIEYMAKQIMPGSLGVGYSLGGRIALGIALKNPSLFSGLVLISSHAGLTDKERMQRKTEDERRAVEVIEDRDRMFKEFDRNSVFDQIEDDKLLSLRIDDNQKIANQLRILGLGSMPYLENQLINLPIPVMYITGTRDTKFAQLAKQYKQQTAYAYHFPIDSDHRVPLNAPRILSLYIKWFTQQVR